MAAWFGKLPAMTRFVACLGSSLIAFSFTVGCSDPQLPNPAPPDEPDVPVNVIDEGTLYDPGPPLADPGTETEKWEPQHPDFGSNCTENSDCESGYCVEGPNGTMCTELCVDECPGGWGCKQVFIEGQDVTFVCVPSFIRLCRPCTANSDCQVGYLENQTAACVSFGANGSFCGGDCAELACPDGFDCLNITLQNGVSSKQCVPADGAECECKDTWGALGLETACAATNEFGSCDGARTCGPDGLTACDAAAPTQELCDGEDNDCNGQTDDIGDLICDKTNAFGTCAGKTVCAPRGGPECTAQEPKEEVCNKVDDDCDGDIDEATCSDGIACTDDICLDDGGCSNPTSDGACFIEGSCHVAGDGSPQDPCLQCLPELSKTQWSNAVDAPCDDGVACTKDDVCTAGQCVGVTYTCTDGLECTADSCDGQGDCIFTPAPGTCAIGTACWTDGDVNPEDDCETCAAEAGPTSWSVYDGADCDDGNACTQSDTCTGETCEGTVYECNDNNPCTTDVCNGSGGCDFLATAEGAACDDAEACTKNDVCTGGTCTGQAYPCDDQKGCTQDICDGFGGCEFEPILEGQACNDGDACTVGEFCSGGVCAGQAKDCSPLADQCNNGVCNAQSGLCEKAPLGGGCNDGDTCTENDTCTDGKCAGKQKDCSPLDTQCTQGQCVQGSCEKLLVAGGCNDGNACTSNDVCQGDTCAGTALDCSYLNDSCNVGVCQGGTCQKQPKSGFCDDGNACTYNDTCNAGACFGTPKDCSYLDQACLTGVCQSGNCQAQQKTGGCNDGNACTEFDQCINGSCQGQAKNCAGVSDQCNNGVCAGGSCIKQPKSGNCSDGNSCTTNDFCVNGSCTGQQKDCSYLNDQCNNGICASGSCIKTGKSGSCSDGNSCTTGDQCVGGTCLGTAKNCSYLSDQCNTGVCSSGSCVKQSKSGSCSDGNSCTSGDSCSGGSCNGSPITESPEAKDTYYGGAITNVTDCAGLDQSLNANLYPSGDIDWYYFKVSDTTGCDVEPKVQLVVPLGANYQLCAYFECNNGDDVDLDCAEGSKVSGPKAGTSGCCSTKTGTQTESVRLKPKCSFGGLGDESGYVDIKVYPASGNTCANYTLKWGDS